MEKLLVKHEMDATPREMTLDEAFLEALELSESRSSDIERQEYALYEFLAEYPDFIIHISEEYKMSVLNGWNYDVALYNKKTGE